MADVICFVSEGRIEEKNKFEKLNYRRFIAGGKHITCGNKTIDYGVVEDFVFSTEEKYGVTIRAIGYGRYNALSSAKKWDQKYNTVQIRQNSDTLHSLRFFCKLFFNAKKSEEVKTMGWLKFRKRNIEEIKTNVDDVLLNAILDEETISCEQAALNI